MSEAPSRNAARIVGVLFLITFATSIPALVYFYDDVLNDTQFILGDGGDGRVFAGAFLEMLLIVANIGTAVVLFPILRRQNEVLALGYVTARVIESAFIAVGLLSLLAVVTLRQDAASSADSLVPIGQSLVAIHDWTFLLGPGFIVGIGNGLLLGYLMYKSELVPRRLAMLGLIGGPLILVSGIAVLFGAIDAGSPVQAIATIPEFLWELSLGLYLTFKGFNPSAPILDEHPRTPVDAATPAPVMAVH